MTPEAALDRVMHCLDRAHDTGFRAKAFLRARDVVRNTDPAEIAERAAAGTLTKLDGIGDSSAKVITEALAGEVPSYLAQAGGDDAGADHAGRAALPRRPARRLPPALDVERRRRRDRGDGGDGDRASATSTWCSPTTRPRLTIAHGLDRERLRAPARRHRRRSTTRSTPTSGSSPGWRSTSSRTARLDLDDDLLARLDVVVASVHSKLRMERQQMTERMIVAVANPHVDILGHCTGRMIGKRPPSTFDADYVFAACKQFGTAVEINCRPERLDPPRELLDLAIDYGCWFSIDTDAHATGQLEWQPHGCDRAAEREVPLERVINTMSADDLLAWTARPVGVRRLIPGPLIGRGRAADVYDIGGGRVLRRYREASARRPRSVRRGGGDAPPRRATASRSRPCTTPTASTS